MKTTALTFLLAAGISFSSFSSLAGFSAPSANPALADFMLPAESGMPAQNPLTIDYSENDQGSRVIYTTSFTNNTSDSADIIDIVNPIPAQAIYLPNTATGINCEITFSIDGGISWDKPENLHVRQKDGSLRPAHPTDYTHIRWIYSAGLAPKASSQVSFAVRYQ